MLLTAASIMMKLEVHETLSKSSRAWGFRYGKTWKSSRNLLETET